MAKSKEPAPEVVETVLERFDPAEEAEIDGDIRFELKLDEDTIPADKHPVWVHQSDVQMYKAMRYTEARAVEDGIAMASGLTFEAGAQMTYRDHILMLRDRTYHERVEARERAANRELRKKMINSAQKTVYLNANGDGPRAMTQRG